MQHNKLKSKMVPPSVNSLRPDQKDLAAVLKRTMVHGTLVATSLVTLQMMNLQGPPPPPPPPYPPPPRSRRQDDGSPSGVVVGASAKSKSRPGGRTVASAAQSPGPSAESQPGASDDGPLSSNPLQAMAPTLNQLDKVVPLSLIT